MSHGTHSKLVTSRAKRCVLAATTACAVCCVAVGLGQTPSPRAASSMGPPNRLVTTAPTMPPPAPANAGAPVGTPSVTGGTGVTLAQASSSSVRMAIEAKDVLDSNDKTINRVAQVYEKFATLITIFIGLVGLAVSIVAGVFAFLAFRSLADFKQHWEGKLQDAEKELEAEITRLKAIATEEVTHALEGIRENELKSRESAQLAENSAQALQLRQDVIDHCLSTVDSLSASVDGLREVMRGAGLTVLAQPPATVVPATEPEIRKQEVDAIKVIVHEKLKSGDKRE